MMNVVAAREVRARSANKAVDDDDFLCEGEGRKRARR